MNVLVVMADHFRFDALGCVGNPVAHTPNLDRLASQSVRFDRCYTQSPVCAAARHSLATGLYAHAQGVTRNSGMPLPGLRTIAHAVGPLGYRRFQLGHMHWKDRSMDTGYEPEATKGWKQTLPEEVQEVHKVLHPYLIRNTTAGPGVLTEKQHWGHFVAGQTIRLLEEAVEKQQPFLCWTAFTEPHPPFRPPAEFYRLIDPAKVPLPAQAPADAPPVHPYVADARRDWTHLTEWELRQTIAAYYGMVALADHYIGQVLDAVDRLGLRDQTAIFFTSDHGDQLWEHEVFMKYMMYEGSTHVPLMVSVPGAPAAVRDEFVEHIDLFPTICELAGAQAPGRVHGRSLLPLVRGGPAPTDWRDAIFSQINIIKMIRTTDWKLVVHGEAPGELYDLRNDPQEFHNRLDDPACGPVVKQLEGRLWEWYRAHEPA